MVRLEGEAKAAPFAGDRLSSFTGIKLYINLRMACSWLSSTLNKKIKYNAAND